MATPVTVAMMRETFNEWNNDKAGRLAAAISYSTIFSIAPLLIVTIAIVGKVLGFSGAAHPHSQVESSILAQIRSAAGASAAEMVRGMVDASFNKPRQGLVSSIIGWVTFIIGATGVFAALQDALNTVWNVAPKGKQSIWVMVRERVASLGMLLVIGFLLLVTFVLNAAIAFISSNLTQRLPFAGAGVVFAVVNWVVSIAVITVLFGLMFKVLPDAKIAWKDVEIGALLTAVLFVVGQALIGLYIGRAGVASAYGAAGALLAILVWIYYSAMILLLGAEFTKVYARERGETIAATTPPVASAA